MCDTPRKLDKAGTHNTQRLISMIQEGFTATLPFLTFLEMKDYKSKYYSQENKV